MPLPLNELARRYIAKAAPAVSGSGGHNQTFSVACSLIKGFDLTVDEARPLLLEYNQRCDPPWSVAELEHKLSSADGIPDERARGWLRIEPGDDRPLPRVAPAAIKPKAEFRDDKLQRFAVRWRSLVNTAWLADRSQVNPYRLSPEEFLRALYPEEKVVIFTEQKSQGQAVWPIDSIPVGASDGVWFLSQPVDGCYHPNARVLDRDGRPRMSRRSEESVTSWRYMVIESDEARARDWMGAVVQLPLAIAALYTSGARSIHALVRVDAPLKNEWDATAQAMKPILVTLGADPKSLSAVRLTRLPGCYRGQVLQKLLYLNPDPKAEAIVSLPRVRNVLEPCEAAVSELTMAAGDIVERDGCKNIDDCIASLEAHHARLPQIDREALRESLSWFESAPISKELLGRLSKVV